MVVLGKEMVVPIRCRCQQEVQDKEEAERKHREFLDQVSRLKANGLQDKSLRNTPLPMIRVTTRKCRKPMTMLSIGAK